MKEIGMILQNLLALKTVISAVRSFSFIHSLTCYIDQHWHRVLNPKICKKAWTKQEDDLLIQRVEKHGESSWKRIAEGLPGRTDIQCRHRFMMLKKYKTQGKKGRPITRRRKSRKSSTAKTFEDLEAELHKGSSEDVQLNQEKTEQELPTTAAAAATAGTDTPQQPVLVTPPISRDEDDQQLLQITSSLEVTRSLADWASLDCYEYIVNCKSERLESDPFFVQHTKHADELLMNALMVSYVEIFCIHHTVKEWHCILSESDSSSIETVSDLAYSSGSDEESPLPKRRKIDQTSDNFECNINGCK